MPGCSTGEEVYSIVIALLEYLGPDAQEQELKVLGTDLSEAVITKARAGRFLAAIAEDVSPERLSRFFVPEGPNYQIVKSVRDHCVFARQDATRDPPFSNLDLISCRNVLIYLGPELQARALPIFHYALEATGFLVLGRSESVGIARDLFSVVDPRHGIHARRPAPSRPRFDGDSVLRREFDGAQGSRGRGAASPTGADVIRGADRLDLARAPAGIIVDEAMKRLHTQRS